MGADTPARGTPSSRWLIWLPLVVPLCFVYITWSDAQIELAWLPRAMMVVSVAMLGVALLCRWLARDWNLGILAAMAVGVGLTVDDLRATALLGGIAMLLIILGRTGRLERSHRPRRLAVALSIAMEVLILFVVGMSVLNGSLPAAIESAYHDLTHEGPAEPPADPGPDIWVILLDGYPGDDAAADLDPTWDRDAFPEALEALGFEVQRGTRTNYLLTRHVLPAMFNARHIRTLVPDEAPESLAKQTRRLRAALEDSSVLNALGDAGYRRLAISSGWADVGPRRVDDLMEPPQITEFEVALMRDSTVGTLVESIAPNLHSQQKRERVLDTLETAAALAAESDAGPRFVFVHVPSPHPPSVFGADGSPVDGSPGSSVATFFGPPLPRGEAIRRQLAEADHIASLATTLLGTILSTSDGEAVVILFSDHGSDIGWNPNDPLAGGIGERTSSSLAVYTPGHEHLLPPGTTPVNVLSRILNAYGISQLATQPDTTWSYKTPSNILDLVEVDPATGELR